ncbi:MAG: 23S rRNA (pseudouridine(1915)-N(3))-methyltransferase RlmH [Bdellovibrionota bacterium]
MKFVIFAVGKGKFPFVEQGLAHYFKNIGHMAEIELVELKDAASDKEKEAELFLAALKKRKLLEEGKARIFLLDERGKQYSSRAWAEQFGALRDQGVQQIVLLIGGAYGFTDAFRERFPQFSLSKMTFPHDLVRLILAEQIYRALHILSGGKYHHD